jgi:hypothetical protein
LSKQAVCKLSFRTASTYEVIDNIGISYKNVNMLHHNICAGGKTNLQHFWRVFKASFVPRRNKPEG